MRQAAEVAGFTPAIKKLGGQGNPAQIASAIELVLEGLHLNRKLNKDRSARPHALPELNPMPNVFKYGAWDGTQHVLDVDAESLLDAMSDDLLEEGDLWRALQRLFRQGAQNQDGQQMPGLQDLLQQLRQRRQQQLQNSNLNDTLKDVREKLQEIQKTERQGIDNKLSDGRERAEKGEIPEQLQKTMERMAQRAPASSSTSCRRTCPARSRGCRTTTSWTPTRARCSRS